MDMANENTPLLTPQDIQHEEIQVLNEDTRELLAASRSESTQYKWKVFGACLNSIVHSLIAASVFVTLWFAFKSTHISTFELHIGLSVTGYQLLMSHAILSLNSNNGWSSTLTYGHRRRAHWILQLAGSIFAIAGSAIMMKAKAVNFTTIHGKLALAALIFTCVSLINGVSSLYVVELRRYIPPRISKISHIVLGTAAFALSTVCLAFGYNKSSFRKWASDEFSYLMIGITSTYTLIIICTPSYRAFRNVVEFFKSKLC